MLESLLQVNLKVQVRQRLVIGCCNMLALKSGLTVAFYQLPASADQVLDCNLISQHQLYSIPETSIFIRKH